MIFENLNKNYKFMYQIFCKLNSKKLEITEKITIMLIATWFIQKLLMFKILEFLLELNIVI